MAPPPTEPVTAGCPSVPRDDTRAADGLASVVIPHEGDWAPLPPVLENPTPAVDSCSEIWTALIQRYGRACLDAHQWEWQDGDWLPHYRYQLVSTITEL